MPLTPNLGLFLIPEGETLWRDSINANFSLLDSLGQISQQAIAHNSGAALATDAHPNQPFAFAPVLRTTTSAITLVLGSWVAVANSLAAVTGSTVLRVSNVSDTGDPDYESVDLTLPTGASGWATSAAGDVTFTDDGTHGDVWVRVITAGGHGDIHIYGSPL